MIEATVIADSVNEQGNRLTTFKLRYPRFIHSEFMTHRVISRNASSSRAIPTKKLIEEVRSDVLRAAPVFWGKNQKGMQAAEELSREDHPTLFSSPYDDAKGTWAAAACEAADWAEELMRIGVHKQTVNRILEPFSHINVIASATEWNNFFGLRLHKDAQPEMRALAIAMWEVRKASTPKLLRPGEWHTPYVDDEETLNMCAQYEQAGDGWSFINNGVLGGALRARIGVSVARCARTSYESFETGKRSTVEEDLALYERLLASKHFSPFEHQATPDTRGIPEYADEKGPWMHLREHGNFKGFRQFRKTLPGEAFAPIPEEFLS